MTFKGNIYITDPHYIAKSVDWGDDYGFDTMDENISLPEFSNNLMKSTGVGDGSWRVYELNSLTTYCLADIYSIIEKGFYRKYKVIGEFCVDSALVCVVYQHEADAYNPSFMTEFKDKPHCWAIVKNFDGNIETYFDSNGELHFIGTGNHCFFTA